jgi:hypothetical protein
LKLLQKLTWQDDDIEEEQEQHEADEDQAWDVEQQEELSWMSSQSEGYGGFAPDLTSYAYITAETLNQTVPVKEELSRSLSYNEYPQFQTAQISAPEQESSPRSDSRASRNVVTSSAQDKPKSQRASYFYSPKSQSSKQPPTKGGFIFGRGASQPQQQNIFNLQHDTPELRSRQPSTFGGLTSGFGAPSQSQQESAPPSPPPSDIGLPPSPPPPSGMGGPPPTTGGQPSPIRSRKC